METGTLQSRQQTLLLYPAQEIKEMKEISSTHIYQSACQKRVVALESVRGALLVWKRCFGPLLSSHPTLLLSFLCCRSYTHSTLFSVTAPPLGPRTPEGKPQAASHHRLAHLFLTSLLKAE